MKHDNLTSNKHNPEGSLLEVLKSHVLQQRWMPKNQIAPLFLVNSSVVLCVCLLKCLIMTRENKMSKGINIGKQEDDNLIISLCQTH